MRLKFTDHNGRDVEAEAIIVATNPFELWTTNDTEGPTVSSNTIGFNNSGGVSSAMILHLYNAATDTWTVSAGGQTFDGWSGL